MQRALPGYLQAGPEAGPRACREEWGSGRREDQIFLYVLGGGALIYKPVSPLQGGEGEAQRVKA